MSLVGLCFEGLEFQAFQRSGEKSWENPAIIPHMSSPILHSGTETPNISARQEKEHQIDGKQDLLVFLEQ